MIDFEIYLQSSYSFNGSLIDIEKAVEKAASFGFKTLGLADINHMYGIVKFYRACLKNGIKPLLGLEVLVDDENFKEQNLLLYAKNDFGYKNLIKISSYLGDGNKTLPVEVLENYAKGIIGVIVTDSGPFAEAIYSDKLEVAEDIMHKISDGLESLFLGLDLRDYSAEIKIVPRLEELGKTVIINNVLYLDKDDKEASTILRKILQKDYDNQGFFERDNLELNLKNKDDLDKLYKNYPIAIKNTLEMIEECNVVLDFSSLHLPKYPLENESSKDKLRELTNKGLIRRLKQKSAYKEKYQEYKERLEYELSIIEKMNYEDYFLIVWDFVLYAKKSGILVGPGRGSAAGSLVAYVLGIVDVDPLEFDLYFERFLNPERITMPDIDMDFPDDRRDEIIKYVVDKYGPERVVSIITYGTFQGKSAVRDVARILGISNTIVDDITSKISETDNSIEEYKKQYPKKYQYYINNPEINQLLQIAMKLNGLCRHTSTHAAGIIITENSIHDFSPTQVGLLNMLQTQYEASDLEHLGLLKIDFLGIRNLSMISETIELIKKNENVDIDIYKIPLDDKLTFKLLQNVNSIGIFQLESEGMMSLMRQMQIDKFEDIATCISLHRPGPMENIPSFIRRRNQEERITYLDFDLLPILKDTQGIIVYQEQIMKIANKFAGYSLGEADVLRRAVSKKNRETLEKERTKFVEGVIKNGYTEDTGNQIYDYIVKFANYGFNKSHAVAYSYIAYWMAYLKANYSKYFLAVLLNAQIGSVVGTKKYIMECQKLDIKILPPRINKSRDTYMFEGNNLRFPYKAIKSIGDVMAKNISAIQQEKEVDSFIDFIERSKEVNSNVIEALIFSGVFNDFGLNKKTLIQNVSNVQNYISFGKRGVFKYVEYSEYDFEFLQNKEKELLGVNFEYHPIHKYQNIIKNNKYLTLSDVLDSRDNNLKFVAVISRVKKHQTKNGEDMAFVDLEDEINTVGGVVFPKLYQRMNIVQGKVYLVFGKMDYNRSRQSIIIDDLRLIER
ncbi:MAG: DNA polymerase III subunit alpha [Candidatus Izemoplasmatales bacterium]|jgi:DNA polymerase-3 subunit alpha|nr:DNA polymerase III subunit alpha [Candidatus Izemoplasmatales bacterium]